MGTVSMGPAGAVGINLEKSPAELPPEAWSDGLNVQFIDGAVCSAQDAAVVIPSTPINFHSAVPGPLTSTNGASWLFGGAAAVYAYITDTLTDVTRVAGAYTGSAGDRWTGGVLGGVTVLTNGVDRPQCWLTPVATQKLTDLPNWPATAIAGSIRPYKQFLVALDITKGSVRYPTLVKWSHPADPGTYPVSWNEADTTKDAGEYPLSETAGYCIDCVPLRDTNVIYKTDSVWSMQYIGGVYVFRFVKLFGDFGIPNRDCAIEYQNGKHFVFTGNDLVVHDGQVAQSIASGRMRKLLQKLTAPQIRSAYVVLNAPETEVWMCFRRLADGGTVSDTAIVYNWITGSLGLRQLNQYSVVVSGRLDPSSSGSITWETVVGAWNEQVSDWQETIITPAVTRMVGVRSGSVDWLEAVPFSSGPCWVERTYLGVPVKSDKAPDLSVQKFITRIWPRVTGETGTQLTFTFGAADSVSKAVSWDLPVTYTIGVDDWIDCTLTGKMFAIRVESANTLPWSLTGFEAELIPTGAH